MESDHPRKLHTLDVFPLKDWRICVIPDLMSWLEDSDRESEIEIFETYGEAAKRFDELCGQTYNFEKTRVNWVAAATFVAEH